MRIEPYLFFPGTCGQAIAFYQKALGAEVVFQMLGSDMPPDPDFTVPEDKKDWILHATLKVGGTAIMVSDVFAAEAEPMAGAAVSLNFATAAEAKPTFDALADGAEITMPWAPTFWSAGFGTLTDKFGIRWMVGCDEGP